MLEFYKTFEDGTRKIQEPEPGCWINAIAPTEEERNYLIEQIGVLPEFVKSSLDEEESSHMDYDDDFRQLLIIFDYPSAEYVVTISLYENWSILEMSQGRIKGMDTRLKTRFFLLLALRISQRFLICLRQIDRLSSRAETRLHQSVENDELIEMLGLEKSLVYFSTSLKSDEVTLNKIMRGKQIQLYEEDEDLLEDVMIEIHQAIEMCNIYSNTMAGTMDTFASIISNNMNIVMNKLTVITIVMAIPNIIFGFYGMNVQLPFPFVWFPSFVAILACVVATVYFFRHNMFK